MELENEFESAQSDVTPDSSSESQTADSSEAPAKVEASGETNKPDTSTAVPYDRFKEVNEQKNQFAEQARTLQEQYSRLESQLKQLRDGDLSKKQEDALIARLKGIDPEFGERFEKADAALKELAELKAWKQEMETKQFQTAAVQQINNLHDQNKVAPELRDLYNAQLDSAYMQGKIRNVQDIQGLYKQIHESYSKLIDGIKRTERESYVTAKKDDAKTPSSQPKGKPVNNTSKKPEFSRDPEEAKAQIVARYLKTRAAENDI